MWAGAALLAIGLKDLEILRRADYQFFELKLGNVCAGKLLQRIQPLFKRSSGRFDCYSPPSSEYFSAGQIEGTIERMQTGSGLGSITRACQLNRPENALQAARVGRRRREDGVRGILYRLERFPQLA